MEELKAQYPEHEWPSRLHGVPAQGEGAVYPFLRELLSEPAIQIPEHWPRIVGMDFGWDHPTAAVWLAWDRDADTVHVYDCYRVSKQTPLIHAGAIKPRGAWIPVAWPHDGLQHDKQSGVPLKDAYAAEGLNMLHERAQFEDGSYGVEAGVMDIYQRMQTGRMKIAEHLADWWGEQLTYHRKDGLIVDGHDDLLDATRYGIMMLRYAETEPQPDDEAYPVSLRRTSFK